MILLVKRQHGEAAARRCSPPLAGRLIACGYWPLLAAVGRCWPLLATRYMNGLDKVPAAGIPTPGQALHLTSNVTPRDTSSSECSYR